MSDAGDRLHTDAAMRALAERCVVRATDKDLTFATAESCTGGLVAHLVTDIPGASTVFKGGWVVYDNARKVADLGVDPEVLRQHGAVSEPVAKALAEGARQRAGTTFAVATTGIAGPTGGNEGKPVGTVWLGLATPEEIYAERYVDEPGDRVEHKRSFASRALELLAAAIEAHPEAPDLPVPHG